MTDIPINKLYNQAVAAKKEMEAAGIPVKEFTYGENGYDFWFKRELSSAEMKKAGKIASKHIKTRSGWKAL